VQLNLVPIPRVIESRETLQSESHRAGNRHDSANDLVRIGLLPPETARLNGHKVDHLSYAVTAEKACDQYIGIWEIELLASAWGNRTDLEVATSIIVQKGGKYARRIKVREAAPVDRTVHADQSHRVKVPYNTVVFNGFVSHGLS
jgi:hypothetical protein